MAGLLPKTTLRFGLQVISPHHFGFGGVAKEALTLRYNRLALCTAHFDKVCLAKISELNVKTIVQERARVAADAETQWTRSGARQTDYGEIVRPANVGSVSRLRFLHAVQEGDALGIAAANVQENAGRIVVYRLDLVLLPVTLDPHKRVNLRQDTFFWWMQGVREVPHYLVDRLDG